MKSQSPKDLLNQTDFGDIDGLYDPRIEEYFIDYEFKRAIFERNIYFVIGRKGTGKSALYNWIYRCQRENDSFISNLSFNNFPFEKLLTLSDDNFSKPNQYQSVWRNIIYSEIASLLVQDESNYIDDDLKELRRYTNHTFGSDLTDLHKQVTKSTQKTSQGLGFMPNTILTANASKSNEKQVDYDDGFHNLTKINARLDLVIRNYVKRHPHKKYIVQFDQLDDNYTLYIDDQSYLQCIISLFKSIYDINQRFRGESIDIKAIAYLRSDIYYRIDRFDPESARWDQYKLNLSWAIVNKDDWYNPRLLQIINKRIELSCPNLINSNPFGVVFDNKDIQLRDESGKDTDVFKFIIHRTFQRPRDVIQFCLKIQEEYRSSNELYFRTIKNAEKEFSLWLLSEIENEIAPTIKEIDDLYELLRLMGRNPYSISDFKARYSGFRSLFKLEPEELLKLLYSLGIVLNINFKSRGQTEIFSIIRNDRSVFNRDLKIATHNGFYQGLHISKFLNR